ncbi:MAG: glycosyltransferase [Proteobacteria bacterium]|nr:glycosyltransferase [Pseudomonadota bacterium]MCG2829716.1 glycosyltransferase [Desulfobacteraceae bacterium]
MDKVRVLNIVPLGGIGGAEKFVLSLCRGHNKCRFETMVCVLFSGGVVSDQIAREGYDVTVLNMANGFDLIRALRLIPIIRNRRIDIVNIHGQNPLGKLCSVLSGVPVIVHTDHGTTVGSPVTRRQRVVLFNRLLTPFIDHFIAISQGMKQSLRLREKIPCEKITLIYNGVDVDAISKESCNKTELRKSLGIPQDIPVLGTVGRLAPEKQYPLLLKSLSILKDQGIEFVALIMGDGPDRRYLESLAKEMSLNDRVLFLGQRNDVIQLLELMDVFVFSSGGEAFSITLLEAMAKARPVVAFDVEGVNEAVVSGKTGYLIPFGDVDGFARKVKLLLESPMLAQQMGQNAFERARTHFDLSQNIGKLEALYAQLLIKRCSC